MTIYIPRVMEQELLDMAKSYPVVTVTGPRQSGKTTLVKHCFPDKDYVSLEDLDERQFAKADPREYLARFPKGVILDEIQRVPELLSYIQGIVDQAEIKGMFILTGSHQLQLHRSETQSLAGRTALLKLLPLSIRELESAGYALDADHYILNGQYPRVYKDSLSPTKTYRDYVQTYIERDVRDIIQIRDLSQFQNFVKLCAGRIGQVFNSSNLSHELGVSHATVKSWLSVLEASFIITLLPPYFENFGKRIIKSPKLYFNDVGLACYLLNITSMDQLGRDPHKGSLFENLVVLEYIKNCQNLGIEPDAYYFRDSNQNEVDLVVRAGNYLYPIEIKSSTTFSTHFLKGLKYFSSVAQERVPLGYLMYAGDIEQKVQGAQVLNFKHMYQVVQSSHEVKPAS